MPVGNPLHWHVSAPALLAAFLAILPMGTLWRLIASHLAVNPQWTKYGQAMAFQF
jgi:hypothetical protein